VASGVPNSFDRPDLFQYEAHQNPEKRGHQSNRDEIYNVNFYHRIVSV
jgi:hypothetical protein